MEEREYDLNSVYEHIVQTFGSSSYMDILAQSVRSSKELKDIIDSQMLKLYNQKQLSFANPNKLNGKIEYKGRLYEIVYVGRELALPEDNFTWECRISTNLNRTATLSILKNPLETGDIDVSMKSIYDKKENMHIKRELLNNPNWIREKLLELANPDLPF